MAGGALSIPASPVFIDLSGTAAGTASAYRCFLAMPPLVLLAIPEHRREGPPPRRQIRYGVGAGALFAGDARPGDGEAALMVVEQVAGGRGGLVEDRVDEVADVADAAVVRAVVAEQPQAHADLVRGEAAAVGDVARPGTARSVALVARLFPLLPDDQDADGQDAPDA